jgi:rubrerythrin
MAQGFNLPSYLDHSRKVDLSDLDFRDASRYPLSKEEIRCLTYMMDIEGHTIVYLKSILSTCAVRDPETTAFLSCWAYEEFFHSRALGQFLRAAGQPIAATRFADLQKRASVHEWIESNVASFICHFSRHFHGVYLTWGAISELTTLEGYEVLATRTLNPLLAELLRRLAKDERRHFAFYYNKAREQLQHPAAQRLNRFVIKHFWLPVGGGVKPDGEVAWITKFILGDAAGSAVAARIDTTIAKLPGLEGFDGLSRTRSESLGQIKTPQQAHELKLRPPIIGHGGSQNVEMG